MVLKMNKKQQKEWDRYMNEQYKILKGHFDRIFCKLLNKVYELNSEELSK